MNPSLPLHLLSSISTSFFPSGCPVMRSSPRAAAPGAQRPGLLFHAQSFYFRTELPCLLCVAAARHPHHRLVKVTSGSSCLVCISGSPTHTHLRVVSSNMEVCTAASRMSCVSTLLDVVSHWAISRLGRGLGVSVQPNQSQIELLQKRDGTQEKNTGRTWGDGGGGGWKRREGGGGAREGGGGGGGGGERQQRERTRQRARG